MVDDPQIFEEIVDETTNPLNKYIFLRKLKSADGVEDYNYVSNTILKIQVKQNQTAVGAYSAYDDGQVFYLVEENVFKILDKTTSTLTLTDEYKAQIGRDGLKFQSEKQSKMIHKRPQMAQNSSKCFKRPKTVET